MNEYSPSHQHWHDTLRNVGVETNRSHLSGSNVGAWTSISTVDPDTITRSSSVSAYYLPSADRKNLICLTGATVQEVILEQNGDGLAATGVRFEHGGSSYVATTTKEVILSAGSVVSPQILESSGIGNPAILQAAGIAVKVDNSNVGENLQDHISRSSSPQTFATPS